MKKGYRAQSLGFGSPTSSVIPLSDFNSPAFDLRPLVLRLQPFPLLAFSLQLFPTPTFPPFTFYWFRLSPFAFRFACPAVAPHPLRQVSGFRFQASSFKFPQFHLFAFSKNPPPSYHLRLVSDFRFPFFQISSSSFSFSQSSPPMTEQPQQVHGVK